MPKGFWIKFQFIFSDVRFASIGWQEDRVKMSRLKKIMTDRLNQIQRLSAFFRFSDELLKLVLVIVEHKRNSRKNNEKYMEWVRSVIIFFKRCKSLF